MKPREVALLVAARASIEIRCEAGPARVVVAIELGASFQPASAMKGIALMPRDIHKRPCVKSPRSHGAVDLE